MRVLLSAFGCDPSEGSELGVGWNWMRSLANQGHEVCVVTRSYHRKAIEAALSQEPLSVECVYYDLPDWCYRWKSWRMGKIPVALFAWSCYLLWQFGAYRRAKRIHRAQPFAVAHHITMAAFRAPSFMGRLGIPFIFGPVGGGESSPGRLRRGFNWSGYSFELLRDLSNALVNVDPFMNHTFSRASLIACTTPETRNKVPARFQSKCMVLPAIGIESTEFPPSSVTSPGMTFLFIGRLLCWKGLQFALRALPEVQRHYPAARLKVIGKGKDAAWLKCVAEQCGIQDSVEWVSGIPYRDISQHYQNKVAFVFPSLRDSGGMVVLEALAAGLPVICLNLGGPAVIVDSSCGIVIDATNVDETDVQKALANAMIKLIAEPELRQSLGVNALSRVRRFGWESAARQLYSSTLLSRLARETRPSC